MTKKEDTRPAWPFSIEDDDYMFPSCCAISVICEWPTAWQQYETYNVNRAIKNWLYGDPDSGYTEPCEKPIVMAALTTEQARLAKPLLRKWGFRRVTRDIRGNTTNYVTVWIRVKPGQETRAFT